MCNLTKGDIARKVFSKTGGCSLLVSLKGYNAQVSSQKLGTAIMKLAEDPKTTVCTESFRNGFFYDIQKVPPHIWPPDFSLAK